MELKKKKLKSFYLFSPISIIPNVLRNLEDEQAEGIIFPFFTRKGQVTRQVRILVRDPFTLPGSKTALYLSHRRKTIQEMTDVKLQSFKNKRISDEVIKTLLESCWQDIKQCNKNKYVNDVLIFLHSSKAKKV